MKSKKWIKIWVLMGCFIPLVYITNYLVDPYGNNEIIEDIYKPRVNERYYQYNKINNNEIGVPNGFIVGSSKVMSISPDETIIDKYYNLWSSVLLNGEKLYFIKKMATEYNPKIIIIGVDFFNFNLNIDNKNQTKIYMNRYRTSIDYGNLTYRKLYDSGRTLYNYFYNVKQSIFKKDGSLVLLDSEEKIKNNLFNFTNKKFLRLANNRVKNYYKEPLFVYNDKAINYYIEIQKICNSNNIKCIFMMPPVHKYAQDEIQADVAINNHYLKMINELQFNLDIFYNFQSNNDISSNNHNWYDDWHYRPVVGEEIINCIYYKDKCHLRKNENEKSF